jgi:hypothetical protein
MIARAVVVSIKATTKSVHLATYDNIIFIIASRWMLKPMRQRDAHHHAPSMTTV